MRTIGGRHIAKERGVVERNMLLDVVSCRSCKHKRLDDGTRCSCGAYQNPNIQLVDGVLRDVRYVAAGRLQ